MRSLHNVFAEASPPYEELTMRLLFCTVLRAGDRRYRIRELEIYAHDDPYTHKGDEQVSSTGGFYFHRTKPGGGWKGGTFMGLDLSFAPVGTAGGVLIRGISRVDGNKAKDEYFDGSCNCVRELLRACGDLTKIQELAEHPDFKWSALTGDGLMRLEELPTPLPPTVSAAEKMEWKATSRVGLSAPGKKPEQEKERKKFHLAPLRFLSAPYQTKKEKTKITQATVGGAFTAKIMQQLDHKKTGKAKKSSHEQSDDDESDDSSSELPALKKKSKGKKQQAILSDSEDEYSDEEEWTEKSPVVWHYWLDVGMDGRKRGWHAYDKKACRKLEGFVQNKGEQLSRTTWHLKSGYFSYEVDISNMTQRNMSSGTVRPIRRVLPGEVKSMTESPIYAPPKKQQQKHEGASGPISGMPPAKKAKTEHHAHQSGLQLEPLFAGQYGYAWEGPLSHVLESQPKAGDFIGPNRSKKILPVREMTFRALMALPPEQNNLIVFGQAPYPRVESASGIAMFDSLIQNWNCPQFGKTVSMRCIAKTAAVAKGLISQADKIAHMRKAFAKHDVVSPPEWFQAMLAQGVLMLNASLTIGGDGISTAQHTKFWVPVMECIVETIIKAKRDKYPPGAPRRRIGFLWWGNEALKTKKALSKIFAKYQDDVEITHMEHYNPAAQGDKFSQPPNHFNAVNQTLLENNLSPIDWLPNRTWLQEHHVDDHAAFITETQELHKLYLDRLQAGLDPPDELVPIVGIKALDLCPLTDACDPLGLKSAASCALSKVNQFSAVAHLLNEDEKGAIYLYTTNVLYKRLNEALRNPNRSKVKVYFEYLRVFLEAHAKMKAEPTDLYRGINKDLFHLYKAGTTVTWWTVSSCTPNIDVAKAFGGGSSNGTLFRVKSKTAVPIMHLSAYQSEEEYVLAPGTVLKVVKVVKEPNRATQIYLEEVEGKRLVG